MKNKLFLGELSWPEAEERIASGAPVFVPVGATEQHGRHLPLNVDVVLPTAIAERAARRLGGVPIVLTHSPDLVPDLPVDQPLVLAGHTHCGQVVLPWIGPLVMHAPSDHWRQLYNPRYRCGIVRDGTRTTIVTAGVGSGTSPIRIGAMPDWWLITLEP